jgi:hypothetical protein
MRMVLVVMLVATAGCSNAEQRYCFPSVRQIDFVVASFSDGLSTRQSEFLYCLYVGNEETERIDREAEKSQVTVNVSLIHPVPGAGPVLRSNARERWYVTQTDSTRRFVRIGPVFEQASWNVIPPLAQHVLLALGPSDDDLLLISWSGISGSLSVFYSPRVQKDKSFHEAKLAMIQEYFRTHDIDEEIPYSRITPGLETSALDFRLRGYEKSFLQRLCGTTSPSHWSSSLMLPRLSSQVIAGACRSGMCPPTSSAS